MYYDRLRARVRARNAARMAQNTEPVPVVDHIGPAFRQLHDDLDQYQYINLPGGRGSGKSSWISLEIVNRIMEDDSGESNAIVFRRTAASLRDSVYAQVQWAIDTLGASSMWHGNVAPMKFTYTPTGAEILFRGLDDPSKLKSIRAKQGVFRYIWIEEFSELPGENFQRNVLQSVLRGGDDFTVFRSFNPPISANHWANAFVAVPDERSITLLTNYTQMPPEWLGEGFIYEAERLKELNNKAYLNEYMGQCTGSGGEVYQNIDAREITDDEMASMDHCYYGVDFGFSTDPCCFLRVCYDRKTETIFILDEICGHGMSNSDLAQRILEKEYATATHSIRMYGIESTERERITIYADAAEPKSIADLRGAGLKCFPCKKFAGCVVYRTKWIQKRTLVIDPKRTPLCFKELTAYEYATTKDGEYTSDLPDKDNHFGDCLAYALDRVIYDKKFSA